MLNASTHILVLGKGFEVLYTSMYNIMRSIHYDIGTEYCTRIIVASCTRYSEVVSIAFSRGTMLSGKKGMKRNWLELFLKVAWNFKRK